jgi:hypothetical protein
LVDEQTAFLTTYRGEIAFLNRVGSLSEAINHFLGVESIGHDLNLARVLTRAFRCLLMFPQ